MTTQSEAKAERARPDRQQETQIRRRRRESLGDDRNLKLHIPEELKDKNFTYRFVNDRPGRVRQLTVQDDWDVVDAAKLGADPEPEKNTAEGTVVNRVGDKVTGERMVLLRKPKDFFEEDKKAKQAKLDELDKAMRVGPAPNAEGIGPADHAYVPGGRNKIGQ